MSGATVDSAAATAEKAASGCFSGLLFVWGKLWACLTASCSIFSAQ